MASAGWYRPQLAAAASLAPPSPALIAPSAAPCHHPQDVLASLKRKLESVARELGTVREEEFARLLGAGRERAAPALAPTPLDFDSLVREIREQHAATAHQQQQHTAPRQPAAAPAQAEVAERRNILPMKMKPLESSGIKAEGTGEEMLLQGFNWDRWGWAGAEVGRGGTGGCRLLAAHQQMVDSACNLAQPPLRCHA